MNCSLFHVVRVGLAAVAAGLCAPAVTSADRESEIPVHAVYETRIQTERGDIAVRRWSFTRRGQDVEYHFADPDVTERWVRDRRANTTYVRVFHRERTAVRYTYGDLLALGVRPDWLRLSQVVAPPAGDGFVSSKSSTVLGRQARGFQRAFGKKRVSVAWLADVAIPAEVRIAAPGRPRVVVRLIKLDFELPPRLDLREFRQIDVTDFGDMERDAFVVRHHDDPLPAAIPTLAINIAEPPHVSGAVRGRHRHSEEVRGERQAGD